MRCWTWNRVAGESGSGEVLQWREEEGPRPPSQSGPMSCCSLRPRTESVSAAVAANWRHVGSVAAELAGERASFVDSRL